MDESKDVREQTGVQAVMWRRVELDECCMGEHGKDPPYLGVTTTIGADYLAYECTASHPCGVRSIEIDAWIYEMSSGRITGAWKRHEETSYACPSTATSRITTFEWGTGAAHQLPVSLTGTEVSATVTATSCCWTTRSWSAATRLK